MSTKTLPTYDLETELIHSGFQAVVGVDEAGCGALAGPVVAGAVLLKPDLMIDGARDSKLMTEKQRNEVYESVKENAQAWAWGEASVEEIFEIGIRPATYLAMRRAIEGIVETDFALIDAWTIPDLRVPQRGVIRGDSKVVSIAAASIVAKVNRDRIMTELHEEFPQYGFGVHKGYGTKAHREAIYEHGPCNVHRLRYKTFSNLRLNI